MKRVSSFQYNFRQNGALIPRFRFLPETGEKAARVNTVDGRSANLLLTRLASASRVSIEFDDRATWRRAK